MIQKDTGDKAQKLVKELLEKGWSKRGRRVYQKQIQSVDQLN